MSGQIDIEFFTFERQHWLPRHLPEERFPARSARRKKDSAGATVSLYAVGGERITGRADFEAAR